MEIDAQCWRVVTAMADLKVIQWATGTVGRHAMKAVHDTPGLELVGALAYDPAKAGRDAGEHCGAPASGIAITTEREAILAMPADCVLYMAQGEGKREQVLGDVCALLASGKNVVSTALTELIYPKACGEDVAARLEAACQTGGVSFHATGIEPGWASEVLPLAMSGLLRRIDHLLVQELMDYSTYPSADMIAAMGFGAPPEPVPPTAIPVTMAGAFGAPLLMVADALGATIEHVIYECEVATAPSARQAGGIAIAAGTTAGKRYRFSAVIDGRKVMTVEHVTRMGADIAPDWPQGRGWHVMVEGTPSLSLKCEIAVHGEDANDQACLATAMHAVHAITPVCAAAPGIRTFLDLPQIVGRGAFTRP
jgi:2,4-diaminopentanoate dehydrogenase